MGQRAKAAGTSGGASNQKGVATTYLARDLLLELQEALVFLSVDVPGGDARARARERDESEIQNERP